MRNVATLTKRELMAYFLSPLAYVVLTVFLAITGFWYYQILTTYREASVASAVAIMAIVLLALLPMLSMRLFATEFQSGTIETLLTAPVTTLEVVLSKYLAALFFLLVMLTPTMVYPAILFSLGQPDPGTVVSAYLGLFLLGSYFVAVGMVASACVRVQVSAAVVTFVVLLTLFILSSSNIVSAGSSDWLSLSLRYACWWLHFQEFMHGTIDTRHVVFFVLSNAFCVFLTTVVVTVRRWG